MSKLTIRWCSPHLRWVNTPIWLSIIWGAPLDNYCQGDFSPRLRLFINGQVSPRQAAAVQQQDIIARTSSCWAWKGQTIGQVLGPLYSIHRDATEGCGHRCGDHQQPLLKRSQYRLRSFESDVTVVVPYWTDRVGLFWGTKCLSRSPEQFWRSGVTTDGDRHVLIKPLAVVAKFGLLHQNRLTLIVDPTFEMTFVTALVLVLKFWKRKLSIQLFTTNWCIKGRKPTTTNERATQTTKPTPAENSSSIKIIFTHVTCFVAAMPGLSRRRRRRRPFWENGQK